MLICKRKRGLRTTTLHMRTKSLVAAKARGETVSVSTQRDPWRRLAVGCALVCVLLAVVGCSGERTVRHGVDGRPGGAGAGGAPSAIAGTGGDATGMGGLAPAGGARGGPGGLGGAVQNGGHDGGMAGAAAGRGGAAGLPMQAGHGGDGGESADPMGNGGESADPTGNGGESADPTGSGGAGIAGQNGGGAGGADPVHDRCADPLYLDFVNGEATVSDDTKRATDEFPSLLCGGADASGPLEGGQIYYRFAARPGREYAFLLDAPGFATATFYVFPAGAPCTADAIQSACQSDGVTGTRPTSTSLATLTPFAPADPGDYIVGVDTALPFGSKFTLTIFEYCGTSGATDCKVKGCDVGLGPACSGNTLSDCTTDGTATVTTDCAMTGKTCARGTCVATVEDLVGNTGWTTQTADAGADGVTLLDFYEATVSRTITELEMYLVEPEVFVLDWRILEATNRAGPYQTIFSTTSMSGGANETSDETTGPIHVPIVAGRFYAMGVALPASARYFVEQQAEKSLPLDVFFGHLTSAAVLPTASPGAVSYPEPGTFVIAEYVTTAL